MRAIAVSTLNPRNVPDLLVAILPLAEAWAIADDFERELRLRALSRGELTELMHSIDDVATVLYEWLGGEASLRPHLTPEYMAFSHLAMAVELARTKLQ